MPEYHPDFDLIKRLITSMPMIFYALDKNWEFLLSDGKGLERFGLRPGEVLGASAKEFYKKYPDVINAFGTALEGKSVHAEHILEDACVEHFVIPNFDQDGEVVGVFGATIDISERKRIENELNQTRKLQDAIMASVPGMVYVYDSAGRLIYWNKSMEQMTGYDSDELYHFSLMDWHKCDEESVQAVSNALKNIQMKGYAATEAILQKKDGSKIPCMFTACPIDVGAGEMGFTGIGLEISNLKEIQKELVELNEQLENKVMERTEELAQVNDELQSANDELVAMNQEMTAMNEELTAMNEELMEKNDKILQMQDYLVETEKMAALGGLVAGVAHEINTPIGVGITASTHLYELVEELIQNMENGNLSVTEMTDYFADMRKASEIIHKNLGRASKLVQSFKQLSVDQSTEPIRAFDVGKYLEEVLLTLSPSLKKSPVQLEVASEAGIMINGNPGAFAQIVTNLVMNAVYHAFDINQSGRIHISLSKEGEWVKLIFSDDGKGMEENVLSRIYEPFYTTKRSHGGTGLGLAIVYSIVHQQFKGSITCQSKPGNGTIFTIYLK